MSAGAQQTTKAHCNKCLGVRNHAVVHVETTGWEDVLDEDEGISINGGDNWTLIRCLGCDVTPNLHPVAI